MQLTKGEYLLQALDELETGSIFIWIVFSLNTATSLLNGLNSLSYVFIAEIPEYWCDIPELSEANWTIDQIKSISINNECQQYDYNYTHLVDLGYDKSVQYVNNLILMPNIIFCSSHMFNESGRSTIVNEWQLVCDKQLYRANTFLVYVFGKVLGNGILGIYADQYGRKKFLIIGVLLYIIVGPLSAFVPWFWAYVILKFLTGISIGAMYSTAYTLLSEAVKNQKRKILFAVVDSMYSVGIFCLISMAYFLPNWRHLQLTMACSSLPIIIVIFFLSESPRWLISQNRLDEAQQIIEKYHKSFMIPTHIEGNPTNERTLSSSDSPATLNESKGFFYRNFKSVKFLFTHSDLRKKILIMYLTNYVTAVVSYSLVFSIDNFKSNRYIYMSIVSVNEILAHMSISVVLMFLSCQKSIVITYTAGFILMMTILAVPEESKSIIMGLALVAKFFLSASFTINVIFISELFPSNVRNTAMGMNFVMGQFGSMTAPYIVDLLGYVAWWAPTTLCGSLTLVAGFFCLMIPQEI
ncbi:organic cation transporter protein-like [Microplitis mediator]|uniref:organic cation transporter protein-like n=1 Tax=Microplitis mediator TaxID=375433 RepID=UPI0025564CA2|nr:organic cation transporter protein-like [Microplitis mediator]